ncbi:hypothetical protein GCM10027168_48490 [Streptomyces capparidis]
MDLLTRHGPPRSHVEPRYLPECGYRPEHSWITTADDGSLVAHLRLHPRVLRVGGGRLPVAGIGDAVTAAGHRGHGHTGRLLAAALAACAAARRHAFALVWPERPDPYTAHGFDTLQLETTTARLPPHRARGKSVTAFHAERDLPRVERFARRYGAALSGTTVRDTALWRAQLCGPGEDTAGFLLAHDRSGALTGYVRARRTPDGPHTDVRELAVLRGDRDTARALLTAVAPGGAVRGPFPPSQRLLLEPDGNPLTTTVPGPMLRVLSPQALTGALASVLSARMADTGMPALDIAVGPPTPAPLLPPTPAHPLPPTPALLFLRAAPSGVRLLPEPAVTDPLHCSPAGLARLMLGGAPDSAPEPLRALLPARDWVLWDADRF